MAIAANLSLNDWMSDAGISKWIAELGVTDAPARREAVRTALQFFQTRMPTLPVTMAVNFLLAIDLSRPVREVILTPGEKVIAFRSRSESEFKLFYTRSGTSPHQSGINPAGRIAVQYVVAQPTRALETYTTGAIDVWSIPATGQATTVASRVNSTGVMAPGGGIQLLIPGAARTLTITHVAS